MEINKYLSIINLTYKWIKCSNQKYRRLLVKMWYKQTMLTSLLNHIKVATKIQKNHQSEPSEIELNDSLTTMELKKPYPSRLGGGVEMWNGLVPHPCVVDKNLEGISREPGVPAPHQAP